MLWAAQEYLHPERVKMHFLEAGVMITGMRHDLDARLALFRHCDEQFAWATNAPDLHSELQSWETSSAGNPLEVVRVNGWLQKHLERLTKLHAGLEGKAALEARWAAYLKLLKRHKDGETLAEGEAKRITHDPEACHNLDALPPVTIKLLDGNKEFPAAVLRLVNLRPRGLRQIARKLHVEPEKVCPRCCGVAAVCASNGALLHR